MDLPREPLLNCPVNTSFFGEMLQTIAERGRALIDRTRDRRGSAERARRAWSSCARSSLSGRGEASGVALAREILIRYAELTTGPRIAFFEALATRFGPDHARLDAAIAAWRETPSDATAAELHRRRRAAPAGTAAPAQSRARRHRRAGAHARATARRDRRTATISRSSTRDFVHMFSSWFNRGFLVLRRIDWSTPANVLEKIIRYEAVHEIRGWDDLRRRIDPPDRRCYAFFHPALVDEPLIFVEVALTREIPAAIAPILDACSATSVEPGEGDDRGVLFDLQLPARPGRRVVRPFPDQAGGRGDRARELRSSRPS